MATEYAIKFYKKAFAETQAAAGAAATSFSANHDGAICFDTFTRQIYVGGLAYGGAISDANYANGILTITKSDGTTQTLDFNDVASAGATLAVFEHMNALIGVSTVGTTTTLNYSGTNYLGTGIDTLVAADKALDTQIKSINDTIGSMDATNVQGVTASTADNVITLTLKGVSETDGKIAQGNGTDTVVFAKVAKTGNAVDVAVADSANVFTGTNVEDVLLELSSKIADSNLTIDGQVGTFTTDKTMIAVDSTHKVLGVNTTGYIGTSDSGINLVAEKVDTAGNSTEDTDLATVNTVKTYISTEIAALDVDPIELATIAANAITVKGIKEVDGKIAAQGTTSIPVDGTVTSSNPLVTKSSVTTAIQDLDVTGYAQGTVTGDTITVYGIKEEDGKIGSDTTNNLTIELDGTYNASTNKVALKSTVTNAINALDTTSDVVPVTANNTNGVIKITMKGIAEEDGVIKEGTTISSISFAKVASTGKAEDITFTNGDYIGSNLEQAVNDMDTRIESLEALPTYDVVVVGTEALPTASANTMHKIYLKSEDLTSTNNTYGEYITVRSGSDPNYKYTWEKLGTTAASLDGYVKTINVNGKEFAITNNTTNVNLGDSITSITDADGSITEGNGFTHDYVDSEVIVISTKDATTGTYAASVISTATVKVQAVGTSGDSAKGLAEASDVKAYVGTQISNLKVDNTTVGTNVKVTYSETNGLVTINTTEEYATIGSDLSVTNGSKLVTGNDITKVKEYISTQVSNAVNALDVADTTVSTTNISFRYREDDGKVSIGTLEAKYATVGQTGDSTTTAPNLTVTEHTTGLVKGTDINTVKTYVDNKVGYEINHLDSIGTSAATGAVAQVVVEEADGKIGTVTVTNISAGVNGNGTTLSATTDTGAVTGADIAKIKAYIDGQIGTAAAVTDIISTITVNDTNRTNIATIGTTNITAAVALVWEEYQ